MIIGKLLKALLHPILNKKVLIIILGVLVLVTAFFVFKGKIMGLFSSEPSVPDSPGFVCADGSRVDKAELCPPEVPKNQTAIVRNTTKENITSVVPIQPVEPQMPLEDPIYPEIVTWTQDELVAAMGTVNPMYRLPTKNRVVYDSDKKGAYYYQGSSRNLIEDPFWLLRNQYFHNSYEWSVNNLRTNVFESPDFFIDTVDAKHEDGALKILSPEVFAQWSEISCGRMESCRNIVATNCTRGNHTLYIWNYFPEQQNTREKRYSLMAMDDRGASLKTFERFYCEPA